MLGEKWPMARVVGTIYPRGFNYSVGDILSNIVSLALLIIQNEKCFLYIRTHTFNFVKVLLLFFIFPKYLS